MAKFKAYYKDAGDLNKVLSEWEKPLKGIEGLVNDIAKIEKSERLAAEEETLGVFEYDFTAKRYSTRKANNTEKNNTAGAWEIVG